MLHHTVQTHSNMEDKYNIENMPQQVDQPYMVTLPISKLYLALKVHSFWTIRFFSFLQNLNCSHVAHLIIGFGLSMTKCPWSRHVQSGTIK